MTAKSEAHERKSRSRGRQIIGFSLPPELALKVKAEAAERQLSLRKLFEEMWRVYQDRKNQDEHAR